MIDPKYADDVFPEQRASMQDALGVVWDHFVVRRAPPAIEVLNPEEGPSCVYRAADGCRCAVGLLLSDEDVALAPRGTNVLDLFFDGFSFANSPRVHRLFPGCAVPLAMPVEAWTRSQKAAAEFLAALQEAHDESALYGIRHDDDGDTSFHKSIRSWLLRIAEAFGLEVPS